jgi:hypothetical protein
METNSDTRRFNILLQVHARKDSIVILGTIRTAIQGVHADQIGGDRRIPPDGVHGYDDGTVRNRLLSRALVEDCGRYVGANYGSLTINKLLITASRGQSEPSVTFSFCTEHHKIGTRPRWYHQ